MRSRLSHASLGAAVMLALLLRWSPTDAQPAPTTTPRISASQQAAAKKLTNEAIAAEGDKNYTTAIALYKQAYQLVPHPILQFNIGQVYMIVGNLSEAERYFSHYLERDPHGPGASVARRFLASFPAADPSPLPAASTPQTASPLSTGTAEAMPSGAARASEHTPAGADRPRITTGGLGEDHPAQVEVTSNASAPQEDELRKTSSETYTKKGLTPGIVYRRTGFVLMGTGALFGGASLAAFSDGRTRIEMGIVALAVAAGGFASYAYGVHQSSSAKAVAWSPVVGSGFAGVALGGTLP